MTPTDKQRTRQQLGHGNSLAVFNEVLFDAPVPRTDIAKRTNLTAASVSRITRQLIDAGLVEEFEVHKTGRPGRQLVNLRLRHGGGYVVGISVNAFEQRVALASLQRDIIAEATLPRDKMLDPKRAATTAVAAIEQLLSEYGIERRRVFGVGVASAGVIDAQHGTVVRAPTLAWKDVPLGGEIERRLGIPVRISNLTNAIGAAEHRFGVAREFRNFIVVHATLGIGMCMVVDGHQLRGTSNLAGLVGEIAIQGRGRRNQRRIELDDVAGGGAMAAKWLASTAGAGTSKTTKQAQLLHLIDAANNGNAAANAVCDEGATHLGGVTATLATALGSEAVILAGPLMKVESYRRGLERTLLEAMGPHRHLKIVVSDRRAVEAAYMLAISELAASGAHLEQLAKR